MVIRHLAIAALAASISPATFGGDEYVEALSLSAGDSIAGSQVRGLNNNGQVLYKHMSGNVADLRVYELSDGSFVTVPEPTPFIGLALGAESPMLGLNDAGDVAWATGPAGSGVLYYWESGAADSVLVTSGAASYSVQALDNATRIWWAGSMYFDTDGTQHSLDHPPASGGSSDHASDGALVMKDGLLFADLKYWASPSAEPATITASVISVTAAVNESGQVAWNASSTGPALIWNADTGTTDTIPQLAGMVGISVHDMNADGHVIGSSNAGAWLYRDGVTELLSDLTGFDDFAFAVGAGALQHYWIANDGTIAAMHGPGGFPDTWTIFVPSGESVPGDVDGDGEVGIEDLLAVLAAWGPCSGCPADLTGDGDVGVPDLLEVLGNWS